MDVRPDSRPRRWLLAALVVLASPACTVVGYPSGRPDDGPVPVAAAPGGRALPPDVGGYPADARPPDPGREYEVFGERYRVLDTSDGYRERGLASWYGPAFHGNPTSSGERFDMDRPSAAHRTLPLHTWVEVVNLDNGRSIVVRVNDRGPFADTGRRIIDLSRAAAMALDMIGPGTARVEVRALSAEEIAERR